MITIESAKLVDLLTDLLITCGHRGVYVGSVRGEFGAEPGEKSLLVGTSTTGAVLGHTWTDAIAGDLDSTLWAADDVSAVVSVYKTLAKQYKHHSVDISVEGESILIRETPELFDGSTELRFDYSVFEDDDPTPGRWRRLLNNEPWPLPLTPEGDPRPDVPRTSWSTVALEPLVKIAKRRKASIHLFANHALQLNRAQIGHSWIGVVSPLAVSEHDDSQKPTETGRFDDRGTPQLSDAMSHLDDTWLTKIGVSWDSPPAEAGGATDSPDSAPDDPHLPGTDTPDGDDQQ